MDVKYYCSTVNSELTGLKARAYDIIRQLERSPKKDELSSQLTEIHGLVDDLSVTVDKLNTECPVDFGSERDEINRKKNALMSKIDWWDQEHIAGGYVGG